MKNKYLVSLGNALFPVLIYLILSECFTYLLFQTKLFKSETDIRLQNLVVVLAFFPVLFSYWNEIKQMKATNLQEKKYSLKHVVLIFTMVLLFGIAWNNLILSIPIAVESNAYQQVNETLLGGKSLAWIILRTCIVAPIVEEIMYRKLVYHKLKYAYGMKLAIVLSSLLFGIVHMNMVQFLYATGIGIFFAYIYEKEKSLLYPIAFHAALNLIAVFREKTQCFLPWEMSKYYQISSVFLAVMSSIIILYIYKSRMNE